MEVESYAHGEPCWQDQSSDDAGRAADFYTGLFGWEIPPAQGEEYGGYRNAYLDGRVVAGISPKMNPEGPTVWSIYIKTDNSAETMEKIRANGGTVVFEPMVVGPFGTMAVCQDSTGAWFGTWEPNEHKGAGLRGEAGTVVWYEMLSDDVAKAQAFYTNVFGWDCHSHSGDPSGGYIEFTVGGRACGGMMAKTPGMPAGMPNNWAVYFAVDDADAAAAKVKELGGTVMTGPTDIQPGRFAVCADSTGAPFNIIKSARS